MVRFSFCLIALSLLFSVVSLAEAKGKIPRKRSKTSTACATHSRKSVARKHRREMVMNGLKQNAARETVPPSARYSDAALLAEAKGDLTPLEGAAYSLLGTRYRFGGNGESGIDCSAFVKKVFSLLNQPLPRTARQQFRVGEEIPPDQARKGDLIFFQTYADYASHVGIYLGDNKMIHASSGGHRVMISDVNTPYFKTRFLGARRINADSEPESGDDAKQTKGLSLGGKGSGLLTELAAGM